MSLSAKSIKEFQKIYEEEFGEKISCEEAADSAYRLIKLFETLYEINARTHRYKERLKEDPKGFHMKGSYNCPICRASIADQETWYDKYGLKCLLCQKAIDKKVIPGKMITNRDKWYSMDDLKSCFNIKHNAVIAFTRRGILKPRIILNKSGKPHFYVFLIKDNKETLPPKKLVESQLVRERREDRKEDRKDWYHSEVWYKFEGTIEEARDYKIMEYLEFKD